MFDKLAKNHCTVYLAGKITGEPEQAYKDKFKEAAEYLTKAGFRVANPAGGLPQTGFTHEAYMRMSFAMLDECQAVCFLSDWTRSKGALMEFNRAYTTKLPIFFFDDFLDWAITGEMKGAVINAG